MKKQRLGSEGPEISVIGYGAWEAGGMAWGPNPPEEQVVEAIETAVSTGVDWIDTAEVYGGGKSESLVSQVLATHPDVRVFTKVAPKPAGTGFAPDEIKQAVEQSLGRVGRDKLDLFQLHWPSEDVEIEATWEAMAGLVSDGLADHIGVSNFETELIERCEKVRHVDSLQPEFSALNHEARDDVIKHCNDAGTGVIAYGPLAFGLLTGAFTADTVFSDDDWRSGKHDMDAYDVLFAPGVIEKNLEVVDALKEIASSIDVAVSQLALAWVFHQEGVTGAIAGSRSPGHVRENSAAGNLDLSEETLAEIEKVIR